MWSGHPVWLAVDKHTKQLLCVGIMSECVGKFSIASESWCHVWGAIVPAVFGEWLYWVQGIGMKGLLSIASRLVVLGLVVVAIVMCCVGCHRVGFWLMNLGSWYWCVWRQCHCGLLFLIVLWLEGTIRCFGVGLHGLSVVAGQECRPWCGDHIDASMLAAKGFVVRCFPGLNVEIVEWCRAKECYSMVSCSAIIIHDSCLLYNQKHNHEELSLLYLMVHHQLIVIIGLHLLCAEGILEAGRFSQKIWEAKPWKKP